jgi:hypothetical protein
MNINYGWVKFYEAAVLETNSEVLPERIRTAQKAIGQRVMTVAIDEAERRAIVKTLNALTILQRERTQTVFRCFYHFEEHGPPDNN